MNSSSVLRGVLAPILTPFEDDGSVATDLYLAHAERLLDGGCIGLVPFGTTGEALSVGLMERLEAMLALLEAGIDHRRLLPGIGVTNLSDTCYLAEMATDPGFPGVLVLPPFFYKNVPDEGLFRYFARLVEATEEQETPIYVYHIPQVAGVGVPPAVVRRLRETFPDRIRGIKDSSGDRANLEELLSIPGLQVYPGQETYLVEALERGAPGCITATANLNAMAISEVVGLWDSGERDHARKAMEPVRGFRKTVEGYAPIPVMKGLLARKTGDSRWWNVRPPLLPADPADVEALEETLKERFGYPGANGS